MEEIKKEEKQEKKEIRLTDYPEGWEKAKSMLTDIPEDQREGYLFGYAATLMLN